MKSSQILTKEEKLALEKLSLTDLVPPFNLRAQAVLLIIDQGLSYAKTAELTGLTIGQVRYCLQRFRKLRMGMFPSQQEL